MSSRAADVPHDPRQEVSAVSSLQQQSQLLCWSTAQLAGAAAIAVLEHCAACRSSLIQSGSIRQLAGAAAILCGSIVQLVAAAWIAGEHCTSSGSALSLYGSMHCSTHSRLCGYTTKPYLPTETPQEGFLKRYTYWSLPVYPEKGTSQHLQRREALAGSS